MCLCHILDSHFVDKWMRWRGKKQFEMSKLQCESILTALWSVCWHYFTCFCLWRNRKIVNIYDASLYFYWEYMYINKIAFRIPNKKCYMSTIVINIFFLFERELPNKIRFLLLTKKKIAVPILVIFSSFRFVYIKWNFHL